MNSRRLTEIARWTSALGALAGIVVVYRLWLHVNPTTVALTLLLFVLVLASRWSLRYPAVLAIAATASYNFFFLPPVGTFTINDPQNWLALFAFLSTAVIGSRLSQRARDEAEQARTRQREVEVLLTLSRELLQTQEVAALINALPQLINRASGSDSVTLFLLEGDRVYQAGLQQITGTEIPHLRQLALTLTSPETSVGLETRIPLFAGVKPRGLLIVHGAHLSQESFHAVGGLVSIALDRAQALEDVARSEASKESERLRTLILDSITHELRTPLTAIKGAASTLLSNAAVSAEDQHELLTIVDEESDRLNRLVGEAVQMAQLESQEVHMNFTPTPLRKLIDLAQESCPSVAATHPIRIDLPELPPVVADVDMISKVLCNLLENAGKYSEPGAPITISAERQGALIVTSVADRGIGIDADEQALIFDRLYRSPSQSGITPGTGMGLAISRAIIESHNGSLKVRSQPAHGSVFSFSLPIAGK